MNVVVVLPTYNEAGNIEAFLRSLRSAAPTVSVLVVDDLSPDGTADRAEAVADEIGGISVMRRAGERGLGNAYRAGFARVLTDGVEVVVSMDADFSHDPQAVMSLVAALTDGVDMVIGSRYVPGGRVVDWPVRRRLLSQWGNRYTAAVLGLEVRDCTSGFRAYRATALAAIDPMTTSAEGYAFLTELVRRMERLEARIAEVPITFTDRTVGESKMSLRIVVESMVRVTGWGIGDRWARRRRR